MYRPRLSLPLALALAATGCFGAPPPPRFEEPGPTVPPPPVEPPPPAAAVYVRGSLQPIFQLTPRTEYGRFTLSGVTMKDADFISTLNNFVTAAQKLDEIGAQIARERGAPLVDLIPRAEDRQRAQQIPFRGNPSDVDIVRVNGRRKAYVPLGGDLMTPGNEVASVDLDTKLVTRIKAGIRPQRIAVHPAGLVFVCNQYSNYITIIDPRTDQVMRNAAGPIEIKTEFYCSDLAFVPRDPAAPDDDKQDLYVANSWRGSVLKYGLTVARDGLSNEPIDVRVTDPVKPSPESQPAAEITGAGANPYRLSLSQDRRALFVANNRGGELARIEVGSNSVKRIAINGPVPDVVQANDILLVPTTTLDRGLPDRADQTPQQISAAPVIVKGLDGSQQIAHPGTLHDGTKSYNFEDLRNGMLTVDAQLNPATQPTYFTDDISPERNFVSAQKILQGALPQAVVVNAARNRAWLAMSGSDSIQEVSIRAGVFRLADAPGPLFRTAERPFALALDESRTELLVASWGGEVLEVLDMNTGAAKAKIDLGYATADYPATTMERGEYLFYNVAWSNNGRKSCASCHFDELLVDGVGYANGASSTGTYHKVPANFNLMTTDSYFWNGSFSNGSYASLAADFQTRTNCELILFGMVEGMASDPATRVGDPANRVRNAQDAQCRPDTSGPATLPNNFGTISSVIAAQRLVKDQVVKAATKPLDAGGVGFGFNDVARFTDFYGVSELRLPPNPLTYLAAKNQLSTEDKAKLDRGRQVYTSSGCGTCHDPNNTRHPYADGLEHGSGAGWTGAFIDTYAQDPRITSVLGSIPQSMLEAYSGSTADREINIHLDPVDYFIPACFDVTSCLVFEDPLAVRGNLAAESERLDVLVKINLANADRGFVPGNVRGQPRVNTPSLRGIWFQPNLLRHGLAHTLKEAVLAPGHKLLGAGERGWAIDALGNIDVHGVTSKLSDADFDALNLFVQSIE
jgi:Di-haem cytochrome c peroxidase